MTPIKQVFTDFLIYLWLSVVSMSLVLSLSNPGAIGKLKMRIKVGFHGFFNLISDYPSYQRHPCAIYQCASTNPFSPINCL